MPVKKWLAVSVVMNATLAGVVAIQFAGKNGGAQPIAGKVAVPAAPIRASTAPEQERILALATLEADARAANPPPRPDFWRGGDEVAMESYQQKVDARLEAMRQALVGRYGEDAVDDPLFTRLFKPLNARFPYLSSRSQLALARLQRTRRPIPAVSGPLPTSLDPAVAYQAEQQFNAALQKVFSHAEYDEYQLRESIVAHQIRLSGVTANEREFRAVFEALQQMDADRSAAGYLAGQDKLRAVLGFNRYVQFSASRDPQLLVIENAAANHQLTHDQVLAVYGVMLDAQLELVRAGVEQTSGATRSRPDPHQVFAQRDRKIASLVGDDVARDLLQAYSNGAIAGNLRAINQMR